jgi:hypothetical protein
MELRSASRSGRLTPRERAPGTHWIGGWHEERNNCRKKVKSRKKEIKKKQEQRKCEIERNMN